MGNAKADRIGGVAEIVFKALFFVYVCLGSCSLTYGSPVISVVMYAAFLLGGCLGLWRLAQLPRYRTMPLLLCALLLWGSHAAALAVNYAYFTKKGAVYLILWLWYFFLLYAQPADRSGEEVLRRFRRLADVFLVWTTALMLLSLGMLVTGYHSAYRDPANAQYEVAVGFFSGRLWGAFQDPNLGAVMSVLSISICLCRIADEKKRWLCGLLTADCALLLLYIALSDSRTGMVCLGVMAALGVLWQLWQGERNPRRVILLLLGACLALVGGYFVIKLIQAAYNGAMTAIDRPELRIDRGYSMAGDVSNRRWEIWKNGLAIGLRRPLTGVSFEGAVPFAREYLPDSYILTNDLWVFNTFDSELVNVFVAQGVPGLVILLIWAVLAARRFFRGAGAVVQKHGRELFLLTAIVCVLAVSALLQGTMFYQTTPNAYLFWSAFGALMFILPGKAGRENEKIGPL